MTPGRLWQAAGLDSRFLVVVGLTMLSAPFLELILDGLFAQQGRPPVDVFTVMMIVLIAGLYGLAESVIALPYSFPFSVAGWLVLHVSLTTLGVSRPWVGRLAALAFGGATCLGRAWYWDRLGLEATDRTLDLALGVIPASAFAGWLAYGSRTTTAVAGTVK